mgnify:CR=1 FL=1
MLVVGDIFKKAYLEEDERGAVKLTLELRDGFVFPDLEGVEKASFNAEAT